MSDEILAQIAAAGLVDRMLRQAAGAADCTPISATLPHAVSSANLLDLLPADRPYWYLAHPARAHYRLGIGAAFELDTHGANRLAALEQAHAGLGQHWRHEGETPAFAGFSFAPGGDWPDARLTIPALAIERTPSNSALTLTASAGQLRTADFCPPAWRIAVTAPLPGLWAEADETARRAWLGRAHRALRDIRQGRLDKIVLARSPRFLADGEIALPVLLARLLDIAGDGLVYACSDGRRHFVGATPERLLVLNGRQITADALAGTAWQGSLALDDDKNRREQTMVAHAITTQLAPFCTPAPTCAAPAPHRAGHLQHWRSVVSATAQPGVTLFALLAALHPTPAVGGFPGEVARRWLKASGERRPGWYSGGIGWLDAAGNGEFHVPLRSALIDGRQVEMQAGAGIVAGSDPQRELAETDAKLATVLDLFSRHPDEIFAQQNDGLEAYT